VIAAGLTTFAVADHDTVAAVPVLRTLAEDARLQFVPGVDITAVHRVGTFTCSDSSSTPIHRARPSNRQESTSMPNKSPRFAEQTRLLTAPVNPRTNRWGPAPSMVVRRLLTEGACVKKALIALAVGPLLLSTACEERSPTAPERIAAVTKAASVSAGAPNESVAAVNSVPAQTSTIPVQWTLTRAACPALWADSVTGTGKSHLMVRVVPAPGGVFQITMTEAGSGTALDNNGRQFQFTSANTFLLRAGPPFQLDVTTSFNLVGPNGKDYRLLVGYVSLFKLDTLGNLQLDEVRARGDVNCVPD
jgi:hypothetical protein